MKKKLIYIVSDIDKALAFEWVALHLQPLYDLQFILIGKRNTRLQSYLESHSVTCFVVADENNWNSISIWWNVFQLLRGQKPQIIHTHLWRANLIGLTASWLLGIQKRIYTRHHATIHYREYPSGLKWDKLCNLLATDIVAISENTKKILIDWDKARLSKVKVIHHGFDLAYFHSVDNARIQAIKIKYKINSLAGPVVGVISRYTKWKGVQFIIDAFAKIRTLYPSSILVLANTQGDYAHEIKSKLQTLPEDSFREVAWEEDLAALYKIFDVFVHVPTDTHAEAFGQTYVEALISGVPSVFTLSGVATEFIRHEENAWVVPFENPQAISEGVVKLLKNSQLNKNLRERGRLSVSIFSLDKFIINLKQLYDR